MGLRACEALPVEAHKDVIKASFLENRVLIVVGETGSGKTTQIPRYLHEALGARTGAAIAVTQPRRVAAVSLATRVAKEMGCKLGDDVGYAVRFDEACGVRTAIKFVTDGMMLREVLADPDLKRYGAVVLDEAHERTLRTDVLFGVVRMLLDKRDDLRVVVMSATLDPTRLLSYFAPHSTSVLRIPGRQHAVRVFYTASAQQDYVDAATVTVVQLHQELPAGDILVFLTGQDEIEAVASVLREHASSLHGRLKMDVLPLYASLAPAAQMRVFERAPVGTRRVVLATNVAETSVTIPGVRAVVDCGLAKMRVYDASTGVETLAVRPISRSSARQRAGRAGREAPGAVYRLYTKDAFGALTDETPPEILRCSLAAAVLLLKASGIADPLSFPYVDAPPKTALLRAMEELLLLGALARTDGSLTQAGKMLAACPLPPVLARTLLEAALLGCVDDACAVLAMLSADNVLTSANSNADEEDGGHRCVALRVYRHASGDHATLLRVFRAYEASRARNDNRWLAEHGVDGRAMRTAVRIRDQLLQHGRRMGALRTDQAKVDSAADQKEYGAVLKSLAAGHFMQSAVLQADGTYRTFVGRHTAHVHPSSVLHGLPPAKRPAAVVFHEVVHTTKVYLRTLSSVEPAWIAEYTRLARG